MARPINNPSTAAAPMTMPAIAPPERPELEGVCVAEGVDVGDAVCDGREVLVGVLVVLGDAEVEELVDVVNSVRSACWKATEMG